MNMVSMCDTQLFSHSFGFKVFQNYHIGCGTKCAWMMIFEFSQLVRDPPPPPLHVPVLLFRPTDPPPRSATLPCSSAM